ncbi:MAG: hypothetical protein KAT58_00955, partial [candidate division Zixibacteria bacterium]|nr:hypothetical protein [candidate division Zixibacteria bacterium]
MREDTPKKAEQHDLELRLCRMFLRSSCPRYLNFLQNTASGNVPFELIHPLEELIDRCTKKKAIILFRPQYDDNFGYDDLLYKISEKIKPFLKNWSLKEALNKQLTGSEEIKALGFVSFPSLERRSFLAHSLIGHEIGHIFALDRLEQIIDPRQVYDEIRERLASIMQIDLT